MERSEDSGSGVPLGRNGHGCPRLSKKQVYAMVRCLTAGGVPLSLVTTAVIAVVHEMIPTTKPKRNDRNEGLGAAANAAAPPQKNRDEPRDAKPERPKYRRGGKGARARRTTLRAAAQAEHIVVDEERASVRAAAEQAARVSADELLPDRGSVVADEPVVVGQSRVCVAAEVARASTQCAAHVVGAVREEIKLVAVEQVRDAAAAAAECVTVVAERDAVETVAADRWQALAIAAVAAARSAVVGAKRGAPAGEEHEGPVSVTPKAARADRVADRSSGSVADTGPTCEDCSAVLVVHDALERFFASTGFPRPTRCAECWRVMAAGVSAQLLVPAGVGDASLALGGATPSCSASGASAQSSERPNELSVGPARCDGTARARSRRAD